jgi:DNA polymerase-4
VVVHVDLDSFFVAVERAHRPTLSESPLIVGGRPEFRGVVVSASREARRCGVRVGMPLADAWERCPHATFVDGAFDSYFAASLRVDEVLRRESRDIEWQSIDEVFVGLPASGGNAAHAGAGVPGSIEAVERIRRGIRALGFDAAYGLARSKLVARIASRFGKPRGVVHVLPGYEARFLAPLKIEMLPGVDPVLARRLRAEGFRRVGQIAKLPDAELSAIAGRSAPSLAREAAGRDASRIRRTALPPPRIEERHLDAPSADPSVVREGIRREAERAGRALLSHGVFARTLTLRVVFADGHADARTASLDEPSAFDDAIFAAAMDLLPRVWNGERLVRAVSISCGGLLSGGRNPGLFRLRRSSA